MQPTANTASLFSLAWRQMARDFRAGELRLLVAAVMLAVAALTAVGFFADRINAGLTRDARQMLGGDAIVASDQPAPAAFACMWNARMNRPNAHTHGSVCGRPTT